MNDSRGPFPDLPILDELGAELHRAARRTGHSVPAGVTGRRRNRGRFGWLTQRPAVATALLILVAAPIVLTARLSGDSGQREASQPGQQAETTTGEPVTLASGTGPDDPWTLTGHGGGCVALEMAGRSRAEIGCTDDAERDGAAAGAQDRSGLQDEAARPALSGVAAVNGSGDGFVFGTVPDRVARVRITIGDGASITVPARATTGRGAQDDTKVFVAAFDDRIRSRARVTMTALDARGEVVARTALALRR